MKPSSKSAFYIISLVIVGCIFAAFDGVGPFASFEFIPSAEGHSFQRKINSSPSRKIPDIETMQPDSKSDLNIEEQVDALATNDDGDFGRRSIADLAASADPTFDSSVGFHEPEERVELGGADSFSRLAESIGAMNQVEFEPMAQVEFLGRNDEGLDQFTYQTREGHDVVQWKNGSDVVVEEIEFPSGMKLVRRPLEFNGIAPETDLTHTDGSFSRLIYRSDGEVEALHFANSGEDAREILARYERGGRLEGYSVSPVISGQ
ncbi:MAG: hypothetical protein V4692_03405 [Bdellovibrionota bacterium]